jgi:hypothetical protein
MVIQRFRDLSVINYRLQGLAKKIYKTQAIVLAKLIKLRIKSKKALGLDLFVKI